MTRLTYLPKEGNQAYLQAEADEAGQILHLKRLLVTLKQHYEQKVQQLQELLVEKEKFHEEELKSLGSQHLLLKELLQKSLDELAQSRAQAFVPPIDQPNLEESKIENHAAQEVVLDVEELYVDLEKAERKMALLEQELLENKKIHRKEVEHLQQLLEEQKRQGDGLETVVSTTSSHYLRQEVDAVKRTLAQDTRVLEARYVEILNEKIAIENQCKQLEIQLEHQSSNLTAFQKQIHELESRKKIVEAAFLAKEAECTETCLQRQELQTQIDGLIERLREKEFLEDKYEQLKEEYKKLDEQLEEALELRMQAHQHLNEMEAIVTGLESELQNCNGQMQLLQEEKRLLGIEKDQIKILLDESETRLKVAQQHLAKKVKEATLLGEKVEEQHTYLADFAQTVEYQKTQIAQLQASVELYQKQEKRLQEQLHEALKGTESQIVKWEEKYFHMYEKWQESENLVRELKKFEEKHFQMQSLLANLGNFMGNNVPLNHKRETEEQPLSPVCLDSSLEHNSCSQSSQGKVEEEKYNLFGMRQPLDKYNSQLT